jgi:hypothetical protein
MSNTQSKQKPYGYLKLSNGKFYHEVEGVVDIDNDPEFLALYTHPYIGQPKRYVATPREPLTLGQKQRLWSKVGEKPTLKDRVNAFGLEIEAAYGIKGNT